MSVKRFWPAVCILPLGAFGFYPLLRRPKRDIKLEIWPLIMIEHWQKRMAFVRDRAASCRLTIAVRLHCPGGMLYNRQKLSDNSPVKEGVLSRQTICCVSRRFTSNIRFKLLNASHKRRVHTHTKKLIEWARLPRRLQGCLRFVCCSP